MQIADHLRPDVSYLANADKTFTVVPKPVLFSDDFAVVDRDFAERELQALRSGDTFPTASYRLQVLAEGGPAAARSAPRGRRSPSWTAASSSSSATSLLATSAWSGVATAVRGVQVALLAFEKSPLNRNAPLTRRRIGRPA